MKTVKAHKKRVAKERNEHTGFKPASIAGRWNRKLQTMMKNNWIDGKSIVAIYGLTLGNELGTVDELQAVLSSAMTQAKDKSKNDKWK